MSETLKLIIATRGSDLALAQAYYIQKRLGDLTDPPETEIKIIKTSGDRIQDIPLSRVDTGDTPDERKGFFTKEIEDALLAGEAHLAVHSYKDLPTVDVPGLKIVSMPQRLTPYDVLLFPKEKKIQDTPPYIAPGSRFGTSSVRRVSQIEFKWPGMKTVELRGNVPTRIQKLLAGEEYDAILLSGAGYDRLLNDGSFQRLGLLQEIQDKLAVVFLEPEEYVSAPAQGALALQCREDDRTTQEILNRLNDEEAMKCVRVEREILKAVEGGCHLPLGCFARKLDNSTYQLHMFLGKEAVDNRIGESFHRVRMSKDPESLANRAISEIKSKLPVVLTGKADRVQELKSTYADLDIIDLPLIRIERLIPSQEEMLKINSWFDQAPETGSIAAVFSVPGVQALRELVRDRTTFAGTSFAVTGEKTKLAVEQLFPGANIAHISPDGTGDSLARELIAIGAADREILAASAEKGRMEFYSLLDEADKKYTRIKAYRSIVSSEGLDFSRIPEECYIVLGSPSSVETFLHSTKKLDSSGHRYCSVGPTTTKALRDAGCDVYMEAPQADFDSLLRDLR